MRSGCVPLPQQPCPRQFRLQLLPQGQRTPMAEMDQNFRLRLLILEEYLTCSFPFVFLFFSFRPPTRSMVSAGKSSMRSLAPFIGRELDINSAQHRENESLQEAYQQLEEVKRERKDNKRKPVNWRRQCGADRRHRVQQRFSSVDVAK